MVFIKMLVLYMVQLMEYNLKAPFKVITQIAVMVLWYKTLLNSKIIIMVF